MKYKLSNLGPENLAKNDEFIRKVLRISKFLVRPYGYKYRDFLKSLIFWSRPRKHTRLFLRYLALIILSQISSFGSHVSLVTFVFGLFNYSDVHSVCEPLLYGHC